MNVKITRLLGLAVVALLVQNGNIPGVYGSSPVEESSSDATLMDDGFNFDQAVANKDISAIRKRFKVRREYISRILVPLNEFINNVKTDAEAFEKRMSELKNITAEEVQNLSDSKGDFYSLSAEDKRLVRSFENKVDKEFEKLRTAIIEESNKLPPCFKYLDHAFYSLAKAKTACPGCNDSIYRYALLLQGLLENLHKNPFTQVPGSVMEVFEDIYEKAVSNEGRTGYLPHEINIANSLDDITRQMKTMTQEQEKYPLASKDVQELLDFASVVGTDNSADAVKFNSKLFELRSTFEKLEGEKTVEAINAIGNVLKESGLDDIASILIMFVSKMVSSNIENSRRGSKLSADRLGAFGGARRSDSTVGNDSVKREIEEMKSKSKLSSLRSRFEGGSSSSSSSSSGSSVKDELSNLGTSVAARRAAFQKKSNESK